MAPFDSFSGKGSEKRKQQAQAQFLGVHLERLEEASHLPLPFGLEAPPPRPDVWGNAGYLLQQRYATRYKPLLIHGHVSRGIVYAYESSADPDGYDATAMYAWFDALGRVRTARIQESYDGAHAAFGRDQGFDTKSILFDMDAGLRLGKVITIVQDRIQHVIFEALRTDVVHVPPTPQRGAAPLPEAIRRPALTAANDLEQLFDNYFLEWTADKLGPVLYLGADPVIQGMAFMPASAVRPDASRPGAWRLVRKEPLPERPWMRILPVGRPGSSAAWRLISEQGEDVGHVEVQGQRLAVTCRGSTLLLSTDGTGGWRAGAEEGSPRLVCERVPNGMRQRLQLKGHFRVSIEALLLALAASKDVADLSPDAQSWQRLQEEGQHQEPHDPRRERREREEAMSRQLEAYHENSQRSFRRLRVSWAGTPEQPSAVVLVEEGSNSLVPCFSIQGGVPKPHHWSLSRAGREEPHIRITPDWLLSSGASFSILPEPAGSRSRLGELTLRSGRMQLKSPRRLYTLHRTAEGLIIGHVGTQEAFRIEAGTGLSGSWTVSRRMALELLEAEVVVLAAAAMSRFLQP